MPRQLVIDTACDLPNKYIKKYNVDLLKNNIEVNGVVARESRDPQYFYHFYKANPLSYDNIKDNNIKMLMPHDNESVYKQLSKSAQTAREMLVLTVSKRFTDIFHAVDNTVAKMRQHENISIRSVNSKTWLSGFGLLAMHSLALLSDKKQSLKLVASKIERLSSRVYNYVIPGDLRVIRLQELETNTRVKKPSWLASRLANSSGRASLLLYRQDVDKIVKKAIKDQNQALDLAIDLMEAQLDYSKPLGGLTSPYVLLTASVDDLSSIENLPAVARLKGICDNLEAKFVIDKMAVSGAVLIGLNSISFAYAAPESVV